MEILSLLFMLNRYKSFTLIVSMLIFGQCSKKNSPTQLDPVPESAPIFTRYIAIGNSITAGYTNDALYREGQLNSYPNILAQKMKSVGGGEFVQPIIPDDEGVSLLKNSVPTTKIVPVKERDCLGEITIELSRKDKIADPVTILPIRDKGPFNNLGVPGAKAKDLLDPEFGEFKTNPFYFRFVPNPGKTTLLEQAQALTPSFFTLWIGNNDILEYASSGGEGSNDQITPSDEFEKNVKIVLDSLTKKGTKGAIANIPDITSIPRFTHIPISKNGNYYLVEESPGGTARRIKEGEYIIMEIPEDSLKCGTWGTITPIPHQYVLNSEEVSKISGAIAEYNNIIRNLSNQFNLALVDVHSKMEILKNGISFNGKEFSTAYQTGGVFSWDGVHLTGQGNAIVANYFIDAINAKYSTKIPLANVGDYPSLELPGNP